MSKIVINHAPSGVVLDVDTLVRFIDEARAAADGHIDSIETLPHSAKYVADMLAPLVDKGDH